MVMLNKEIKIPLLLLLIFTFTTCNHKKKSSDETGLFMDKSISVISKNEYYKIHKSLEDTLKSWALNGIWGSLDTIKNVTKLDTLLCFNEEKNKLIGCVLSRYVNKQVLSTTDNLFFVLGFKINDKWYFQIGASVIIPREMFENHPINQPLSYRQLHEMAMKNIYKGYLNADGKINENWFKHYFEGPGWGDFNDQESLDWYLKGKRFSNKDDFYKFLYLENVKGNWRKRDTTKPLFNTNGDTLRLQ